MAVVRGAHLTPLSIALRAVERRMIYEVSEGPARFSCNWLVKTGREAVEHSAAAV
jgi:hypothetical protein